MVYIRSLLSFVGLFALVAHAYPSSTFQDKCSGLAGQIQLNYTFDVNIAAYLPANGTIDYVAEGLNETCLDTQAFPIPVGVCRLNLRIATSDSSETYMEVWLPENYSGRTLTTGNGGLAGCIQYPELAYGASNGYASFGTNAGHNGTSAGAAYQKPEVLEDLSWRAVYTGAVVGKSITKQFYEKPYGKSYYIGCSMGGRQGFKAIQNNPDLFDGVIVGAPAVDLYAQLTWFGFAIETLGFDPNNTLISLDQWTAVQAEAIRQCDGLDGANDGILEDPAACKFDWAPLICSDNATALCLTNEQVEAASKLFAPVIYNDEVLHPTGHYHSYEPVFITWLYSDIVYGWVPEVFRYIIYQDLSWDFNSFTLADAYAAKKKNPADLETWDPNISAFRDRGGKVLHWHGMDDQLLSRGVSDTYYKEVQSALNASVADLDHFYRYFRASGVQHCSGGPGANMMGQTGSSQSSSDPDDNMLARITQWVENDNPPEFVRGTKYVNDTKALGVEFTRKHCKYPKVNKYTGTGNGTDEEGWQCVES